MSAIALDPKIIEVLSQIKTPLGLAGVALLLAAIVFTKTPARKNAAVYMFILALVSETGAIAIFGAERWASKPYILTGIVYQGDVRHKLSAHVALSTNGTDYQGDTDLNGRYTIEIKPEDIGVAGIISATAVEQGYNPSEPIPITLNNPKGRVDIPLSPLRPKEIESSVTNKVRFGKPASGPLPTSNSPPQPVPPQNASGPEIHPQSAAATGLTEVKSTQDEDDLFNRSRTSEIELMRAGKGYFDQDNYVAAIRFYEQARQIETSQVWRSDYPFLAASYFFAGRHAEYEQALADMMLAVKHGDGAYLGHKATLGFLMNSLGVIRKLLPSSEWSRIDQCIDGILAQRNKTVS